MISSNSDGLSEIITLYSSHSRCSSADTGEISSRVLSENSFSDKL